MNSFGLVAAVGVCLGGAAAYALLRQCGVEIGKRDFLGAA